MGLDQLGFRLAVTSQQTRIALLVLNISFHGPIKWKVNYYDSTVVNSLKMDSAS